MKDNRAIRSTEWQTTKGIRSAGGPKASLKRPHRGAIGSNMDEDSKPKKAGGLCKKATSCSGPTEPGTEPNRIELNMCLCAQPYVHCVAVMYVSNERLVQATFANKREREREREIRQISQVLRSTLITFCLQARESERLRVNCCANVC